MATITSPDLVIIANDIFALMKNPLLKEDFEKFSDILNIVITGLQTDAKASDPDASAWISAHRSFIMNSDLVDRVITMDSKDFTFLAGKIYCCEPTEAEFFLSQAVQKEFNFTRSDFTTWSGVNGIIQFFKS